MTDPEKLEAIRDREADITKERVQKLLAAGANVILCSGGIDDLCLKVCCPQSVVFLNRKIINMFLIIPFPFSILLKLVLWLFAESRSPILRG